MAHEPLLRPYGEPEPDSPSGTPHLSDYWQIITRRIWLVLAIFMVTTMAAIWAASKQQTYFQANASMQVNDPLEQSRLLTAGTRLTGMALVTDPVQSEIEVLTSARIAQDVVTALGLRLVSSDPDIARSDLMAEVWISDEVQDFTEFALVYDEPGEVAVLRWMDGTILGQAAVLDTLDAGMVRFQVLSPPESRRSYDLWVQNKQARANEIRAGIAAFPREATNFIDASYTGPDANLAPAIINTAGYALAQYGANRVRASAATERNFIQMQLDSARTTVQESQAAIRRFKESERFLNLTSDAQALVRQSEEINERIGETEDRRVRLMTIADKAARQDLDDADLVALEAQLGESMTPQMREMLDEIRERNADLRRVIQEERKTPDHPQAVALRSEIRILESQLAEAIGANQDVFAEEVVDLMARQDSIRSELDRFPSLQTDLAGLELKANTDRATYEFLLSQLYQAQITEAAAEPYVQLIDPAFGTQPILPRGRLNVLLGALLGLILGLGAAFFLEYLDRTVRTSADVETLLGIPVLGVIPRLRRPYIDDEMEESQHRRNLPLIVAADPVDPAAEAYRNLRMNLMFMSTDEEPIRTITVSSAGPDEGKSTTAVNFAIMMAQQGQRVLLIDGDLRRPALHRSLDVLREPGLTNLLVGEAEIRECVRPNVLPNLDFLPSGPFPPNPSELLNSKAMHRLLQDLEGKYGSIVIDCPPVLAVTDAALLASNTDGIMIVLRSGETEQKAAERAVDQLRRIGVRVLGAILNEVATTTTEESYYLQYYYSYNPVEKKRWDRLREGLGKARFW
jgi:tyrosine-protein kinase Etk/Wzc